VKCEQSVKKAHSKQIYCMQSWRDEKGDFFLATGSSEKSIKIWRLNGDQWQKEVELQGPSSSVRSLCFLRRHKLLVSASVNQMVTCWDLQRREKLWTQTFPKTLTCVVADGAEQLLATGCEYGNVYFLEAENGERITMFECEGSKVRHLDVMKRLGKGREVKSLAFSPGDVRLAVGEFKVKREIERGKPSSDERRMGRLRLEGEE